MKAGWVGVMAPVMAHFFIFGIWKDLLEQDGVPGDKSTSKEMLYNKCMEFLTSFLAVIGAHIRLNDWQELPLLFPHYIDYDETYYLIPVSTCYVYRRYTSCRVYNKALLALINRILA